MILVGSIGDPLGIPRGAWEDCFVARLFASFHQGRGFDGGPLWRRWLDGSMASIGHVFHMRCWFIYLFMYFVIIISLVVNAFDFGLGS